MPVGSVSNILINANFLPEAFRGNYSHKVMEGFCSSESVLIADLVNCETEFFSMSMDRNMSMLDIKGETIERAGDSYKTNA